MRSFHLNFLAIQEARSEAGTTCARNILRFATGSADGQYGIELWCDLDLPFGHIGRGRALYFTKDDFQVIHADPRRLLLRCDTSTLSFWIFAGHAPHSGHPSDARAQWWEELHELFRQYLDEEPLIILIDANASPGDKDNRVVFQNGFSTSANTSAFRTLLENWRLCLPATSGVHTGTHDTWISVDGSAGHCIDHVALPQDWAPRCTTSQVLTDFDLANLQDDHRVVAVQLQWSEHRAVSHTTPLQCQHRGRAHYQHSPEVEHSLAEIQALPWHTDVETQSLEIVERLHSAIKQKGGHKHSVHKPYIDPELWKLRTQKLAIKKNLRQLRKRVDLQIVWQCFQAWKPAVSQTEAPSTSEVWQYQTSLQCCQVRLLLHLRRTCQKMKKLMKAAKQKALDKDIVQQAHQLPAAELLRRLRSFVGPSNPLKKKTKPLPLILNEQGQPCTRPREAVDVWARFFQDMEGGQRMTPQCLREKWIEELCQFQQSHLRLELHQLPSLTDLEMALRRVSLGRACGPDGLPGELCKYNATKIAKLLFAPMVKTMLHGHEPLAWKGGKLTPAFKGKGPGHSCSSYRSLLVSNHLGKAVHRTIRQKYSGLFEAFLQAQQTGGRKHVPVQLAVHQLRAFQRRGDRVNAPTGILYLDLTEAFYRILREAPMGGDLTDELVAHVLKRMKLPEDSMHRLHALLQEPCALTQAGFPEFARNAIQSIHTSTHFWVQGQSDVCRTTMGSRPGDPFADWIFSFAWACILKEVERYMVDTGITTPLQGHHMLPLFGRQDLAEQSQAFIGPNWMDDLALCISSSTCQELVSQMSRLTGFLIDLCEQHCMTPNLQQGKTEIQLSFRGAGCRTFKRQYYGPSAPRSLRILCEHGAREVQLVSQYRHLGGISHHCGDLAAEIRRRTGIAHGALNQHRKILFQNPNIAFDKRCDLFQMLVMSKLMYGADSWVATNDRTHKCFYRAILKLYRRLLRITPEQHISDDEVLCRVGLPCPEVLLRQARLRYFATLVHTRIHDIWAIISTDVHWCRLLEDDMIWMWQQLRNASHLPHPADHYEQWFFMIQHSPGYWKRLIRRATTHCVQQRQRLWEVAQFHEAVLPRLWTDQEPDTLQQHHYGCMLCQRSFKNAAGEAAHMCRAHAIPADHRRLFDQPTCGACMKYFHTMEKMKAHLYYSVACRRTLQSRNILCDPGPGAGSSEDRQRERLHDRLLPPLPCAGPHPLPCRPREDAGVDHSLHTALVDLVANGVTLDTLEMDVRGLTATMPTSWSKWWRTLLFFMDTLVEDDAQFFGFDLTDFREVLRWLSLPEAWPFLGQALTPSRGLGLEELEAECSRLEQTLQNLPIEHPQPLLGKHRILLHAFSGRRRIGDVQFFLDQFTDRQAGYVLHVVSLDIVIDPILGDAMNQKTRAFWLDAIRKKHVVAFLGGPPCESWSYARGRPTGDPEMCSTHGPRVIRDAQQLWGFSSVSLKELRQLITGNSLLCFSIMAFVEILLIDGFAVIEHPAEPQHDLGAASIWRLPILRAIASHPHVQILRFSQGLLGSYSAKPTNLLTANLPDLILSLHANRVRMDIPKTTSIGKDHTGRWKTTTLKEYPPALCRGLAAEFSRVLHTIPVDPECVPPSPDVLEVYQAMVCTDYGDTIGADYVPDKTQG